MRSVQTASSFGAHNKVLLALAIIGTAAAVSSGFVDHAPNRLVSGRPLPLWHIASAPITTGICAIGIFLFIASLLLPQTKRLHCAVMASAAGLLLLVLYGAGEAAASLAMSGSPAARTSLGPAFWAMSLCALLAIVDALQRLGTGSGARVLIAMVLGGIFVVMASAGVFDALSIMREYVSRRGAFTSELLRHCELVLATLGFALLIGVPFGILAARRPSTKTPIFSVLNLLQTIPSVALFGLLIAPLSALAVAAPALGAIGVHGIGFAPAVIALVLYSLLPVVRNTHAGITSVDPAVIETASGMGFTPRHIFLWVEVPLALPVFLAGVRIVMVQAIGLAVVADLIGAGGLGTFVFQGLGQYAVDLVLLGTIPAIFLALTADFAMRILIAILGRRRAP